MSSREPGQPGKGLEGQGSRAVSGRQTESLNLREEQQVVLSRLSVVLEVEINMERISFHCGARTDQHALLPFSS